MKVNRDELMLYSDAFGDLFSKETKAGALARLQQDPPRVLQLLRDPQSLGLTQKGAADALEEIVGILSADQAAKVMEDNLTAERLSELIAERGDLGSAAAMLAGRSVVVSAIMNELADGTPLEVGLTLYSWAKKLHEREDWKEFLSTHFGGRSFKWYLLMVIWNEAGRPGFGVQNSDDDDEVDSVHDISLDFFADVGLEADLAIEELDQLVREGKAVAWEARLLSKAKRAQTLRKLALRRAPLHTHITPPPTSQAGGLADEFEDLLK